MSDISPTITIEIGNLDGEKNVYPVRLLSPDEAVVLAESFIEKKEFERGQWAPDPISTMLDNEEDNNFKVIGSKLFALIHRGEVGEKWDEFIYKNTQCRVQLRIKPDEIFAFPWELVCKNNARRLAVNSDQTFYRAYQPGTSPLLEESSLLPLRVLIVIGASRQDSAVLAQDEIKAIETKIRNNNNESAVYKVSHRLIDIEKLWNPTLAQLKTKYEEFKPHIFHFIGHGEVDEGNARLIIDSITAVNEAGENIYNRTEWQYDSILADFEDWNWLPRLVLINSCRTETGGEKPTEEQQQHIWSIGDIFRELGIPAIIAMQADISGRGAGVFSGTLYKHLAEFDPIDKAVGHARNALKTLVGNFENREWAIPVLTLSQPPEKILPFKLKIDENKLNEIKSCPDLTEVRFFSDRVEKRRELLRHLYPPTNKYLKDLVIVKGKENAGKSWITKFCLEALALLDLDVRYVPVGGHLTIDWLDFLLQIRDGDSSLIGSSIRKPLNEEAFYSFNWDLINRTNTREPEKWDGQPVKADKADLTQKLDWSKEFIEKTFTSFRTSLLKSAGLNKPLVIVFDDFPKNDNNFFQKQMTEWIIPNLIIPLVNGNLREMSDPDQIRSVKFILVLREDEFEKFGLAALAGKFTEFSLDYFSLAELKSCINEYAQYTNPDITDEDIQIYLKYADLKFRKQLKIAPSEVKTIVD